MEISATVRVGEESNSCLYNRSRDPYFYLIFGRIKSAEKSKVRMEQQTIFSDGISCTDQIATLRIIIDYSLEWQSTLYVNFIDFRQKAFDMVDRTTVWIIMRHYGIQEKIAVDKGIRQGMDSDVPITRNEESSGH